MSAVVPPFRPAQKPRKRRVFETPRKVGREHAKPCSRLFHYRVRELTRYSPAPKGRSSIFPDFCCGAAGAGEGRCTGGDSTRRGGGSSVRRSLGESSTLLGGGRSSVRRGGGRSSTRRGGGAGRRGGGDDCCAGGAMLPFASSKTSPSLWTAAGGAAGRGLPPGLWL